MQQRASTSHGHRGVRPARKIAREAGDRELATVGVTGVMAGSLNTAHVKAYQDQIRGGSGWKLVESIMLRQVAQQVRVMGRSASASVLEEKLLPGVLSSYEGLEGRGWRSGPPEYQMAVVQLMKETVVLASRAFQVTN